MTAPPAPGEHPAQPGGGADGFTLIELMVVVLILAILAAIAIPTYLGARVAAQARAAQSELGIALTAEQTYWTGHDQHFSDDPAAMTALEPAIVWSTGPASASVAHQVAALTFDSDDAVLLQAQAAHGDCYTIEASNDPSAAFTGYNESPGPCSALSAPATLAAPAPGSAAASVGRGFYASW